MEQADGFRPAVGSYEEALALVEGPPRRRRGEVEVNWTTIRHFCVAVEDGNPSHWDPAFAAEQWGSIIAPPAMLMSWVSEFPWHPDRGPSGPESLNIPLPGTSIVNIANVTEYFEPVHVGDHLVASDVIESISTLKHTAVGDGHFVTTRATFTRDDGTVVAIERNTLLRYTNKEVQP